MTAPTKSQVKSHPTFVYTLLSMIRKLIFELFERAEFRLGNMVSEGNTPCLRVSVKHISEKLERSERVIVCVER